MNRSRPGCSRADVQARRAIFAEKYIATGNATRAALEAGFSPRTAGQQGSRLLKDVEIQREVSLRRKERIRKFELSTDRVMKELARIVFVDPRRYFHPNGTMKDISELDDDCAAAVASIDIVEMRDGQGVVIGAKKRIKFWDKVTALSKAMTALGMFEKNRNDQGRPFDSLSPEEAILALELVQKAIRNHNSASSL